MNIKIDERHIDGITVLDIVGKLTIDEAAEHLQDKINSLLAQKETRIVLDLEQLPYITAAGSAADRLVRIGQEGRRGDEAAARELTDHDLLSITSLVTVLSRSILRRKLSKASRRPFRHRSHEGCRTPYRRRAAPSRANEGRADSGVGRTAGSRRVLHVAHACLRCPRAEATILKLAPDLPPARTASRTQSDPRKRQKMPRTSPRGFSIGRPEDDSNEQPKISGSDGCVRRGDGRASGPRRRARRRRRSRRRLLSTRSRQLGHSARSVGRDGQGCHGQPGDSGQGRRRRDDRGLWQR